MGLPPANLNDLSRAASTGDRAAFDALHARLNPGLRAVLSRRGCSPWLLEDLCQRTWTGVWEACSQGRYDPGRSAISTFVYAVMHHVWVEHLRRAGRRDEFVEFDESLDGPKDHAPGALGGEIQVVREALAGSGDLTDQERWVLRQVGQGQSDRDLAKRLGVSPSTANQTKQAAMEKLRRILGRAGYRAESAERGGPGDEEKDG